MNKEDISDDIFDAISNIMKECNVKKDSIDAGSGGKYLAFTIDSVLDNIRPLLAKYKLIMSIKHKLLESQYIDVENKYGKKTKHNVIVETILILKHKNSAELEFQSIGEASDSGDKAISKAQTDSYKKILTQMFAISDGDDKDKDANDKDEEIKNVVKKKYEIQATNNKNIKPEETKQSFEDVKQSLLNSKDIKDLAFNFATIYKQKNDFTNEQIQEIINIKDNLKSNFEIEIDERNAIQNENK